MLDIKAVVEGRKKQRNPLSDCICACKFTFQCVCVYRSVYSSDPLPDMVVLGGGCLLRPRSIMAGVSAALGGDNNDKKKKKTRGHSPRLVYRAGPFLSLGPPKEGKISA